MDARLAAMQALDLVHRESKSRRLCVQARAGAGRALSKPAHRTAQGAASKDRRGNRAPQRQSLDRSGRGPRPSLQPDRPRPTKPSLISRWQAAKASSVYSLDEAATHFTAALALLDKNPDCASDDQVAEFLVSYTHLLNMSHRNEVRRLMYLSAICRALIVWATIQEPFSSDITTVLALLCNTRYREAAAMQRETSPIADRLGDSRSRAYSLASEIHVSTIVAPKPLHEFEILKREAIKAASDTTDAYIQNWTRCVIGWEEFHRGRMNECSRIGSRAYASWSAVERSAIHGTGLGFVDLDCPGIGFLR